jgi:hypothetical protein
MKLFLRKMLWGLLPFAIIAILVTIAFGSFWISPIATLVIFGGGGFLFMVYIVGVSLVEDE